MAIFIPPGLATITAVAQEMVRYANSVWEPVTATYDGIELIAHPADNPLLIEKMYQRMTNNRPRGRTIEATAATIVRVANGRWGQATTTFEGIVISATFGDNPQRLVEPYHQELIRRGILFTKR